MVLDTRTRTSIYQKLVPVLGEDDANALMSQFPAADDELVTKSFLRAGVADVRAEFASVRAEFADVRADIAALETRLTLRLGAVVATLASLMVVLKLIG